MFPPLTTGYEDKDGNITAQSRAFYTRLAKGGVGYIVLGDVAPIRSFAPTPKLFDDSQIESFRLLAESVHLHGAKLGIQIFHPEYDCEALNKLFDNGQMGQVRTQLHHDMQFFINEVTEDALLKIIENMCECAIRAEKAGVDVIQIHGDRLVGALCSTKMNSRTDQFGGSLENRTRFALLLVHALKKAVPNMLLEYKFPVVTPERGKGGIDEIDAPQFAKWLEDAGIDMLHVAQANHTGNLADTIPPMGVQPYCFFVDIANTVKKAVSIPVSAVGRIIDPEMAEEVVQSNRADIIGLGRALLADPDWINKTAAGNACDIRRCISCNRGCTDNIQNRAFVACVLNAENGFEEERSITPAAIKKNIIVIGGGPAGLEAARVAAKKGHKVIMFEKEKKLGGQLNIADVPPRKREMHRAVQDLVHAVRKEDVAIHLGEPATIDRILSLKPNAVIIAVGAKSFAPSIPGIDGINVCDAWDVLSGERKVKGRVAVIGGGLVGCETAEYLAEQGCKIALIEKEATLANGISTTVLPTLLENYRTYGVEQYTGHKVLRIEKEVLICEDAEGKQIEILCDFVITALGSRSLAFDTESFIQNNIEVIKIGDCKEVADISHAIKTGYDAANAL
ncbi:bilirubin reductase, long form [Flavobacterium antarcticum]